MRDNTFFEGIEKESLVCARCGYCRVDCPIYLNLGWESSSPRAKLLMARNIIKNNNISDLQAKRIFQCTLCGRCREQCSTYIDTVELWKNMREEIAKSGNSPENIQTLTSTIQESSNITGDEQENRKMWLDALDEKFKDYIGKEADVLYFPGCLGSLYPMVYNIPQSFVQILDSAKINFSLLAEKEGCCGFPLIGAGEFSKGKNLLKNNVKEIENLNIKTVVTTCPSCYHTLKHVYPKVLGKKLNFEVIHASQFLEKLINENKLELKEIKEKVTYHDPCDLGRNGGEFEAPRNVIKSIPSIEFIEMRKNREKSNCCGGGGNLQAVDEALMEKISASRIQEAAATGAKILISSCQQCKRSLQNAARKNKIRIKVMDLTELLWKSIKG